MDDNVREPYVGLNLWIIRILYISGLLLAIIHLYVRWDEFLLIYFAMPIILGITFEIYIHIYWISRQRILEGGDRIEAKIISKTTTRRSALGHLTLEYSISGKTYKTKGIVADSDFFKLRQNEYILVSVLRSKPNKWVLNSKTSGKT